MPNPFRRISTFPRWLELAVRGLAALLYKVRAIGAEQVPAEGGAVLIANHLSYADVIVLQLACPRPLRFVGYETDDSPWYFRLAFRLAGVIPISPERTVESMRRALKALAAGELVAVFPEGHIARGGQMLGLKRGYEIMARKAGVPVVPAAIDGMWGSVFSFSGSRYLFKSPRLTRTPVCVAFGRPLSPAEAEPSAARRALLDLAVVAFGARPILGRNLGREIIRELAKHPGRTVMVDRTAERRPVSGAALLAAAAVLGRRLKATVPERRVGIVLPAGAGAVIANLGVLCAGKVPVNLNFVTSRASAEASLRVAGINTMLSADAMREKAPGYPWPERTLDLRAEIAAAGGRRALLPWLAAAWLVPNQWLATLLGLPHSGGDQEAAVLFTSGSAGEPKGAVLTHRNIMANCAQFGSLLLCSRPLTFAGCLPIFHSFGFTVTLCYPLLYGQRMATIPNPLDSRRLAETIHEERLTVLVGAPTFLRPLIKKARPEELRSLEIVVAGAEKLPADLAADFKKTFGIEVLEGYGLTEASPVVSVNQPDPPITTSTGELQTGGRVGTVGRLLPGLSARVIDPETGADVPIGSAGVLWLRGPNIFGGYLAGATADSTTLKSGGWLATGDLARFDEEGFLTLEGRLSRFSKVGGEMVPHAAIERKVVEEFGIDETEGPAVAVVGVPDVFKGEALVLISSKDISHEELRARLHAAGLPNLWLPKVIRLVERIPVLGTGKLDLDSCRRMARDG